MPARSRLQTAMLFCMLVLPGQALSDMAHPVLRHAPSSGIIWTLIAWMVPDRFIVLDDDEVGIRQLCRDNLGLFNFKERDKRSGNLRPFKEGECKLNSLKE